MPENKQAQRTVSVFMIAAVSAVFLMPFPFATIPIASAGTLTQWDTESQFGTGSNQNTTTTRFSGDVTLDLTDSYTETTKEEFDLGNGLSQGYYGTSVDNREGGEVILGSGWKYTSATDIPVGPYVSHAWVASDTALLYVAQEDGLKVIDTKNNAELSDDELLINYNSSSTPPAPNIYSGYQPSSSLLVGDYL